MSYFSAIAENASLAGEGAIPVRKMAVIAQKKFPNKRLLHSAVHALSPFRLLYAPPELILIFNNFAWMCSYNFMLVVLNFSYIVYIVEIQCECIIVLDPVRPTRAYRAPFAIVIWFGYIVSW